MESSHTSSIRFLDLAGHSIDAPLEWTPAQIILPVDALCDLNLHCQPLGNLPLSMRLIDKQIQVVADWPRANTGHYRLILQRNGQLLIEQIVTVQSKKIEIDDYSYMLEDLEYRLPASIALGLQRNGALAGLKLLSPGLSTLGQEIVRLRRAIRGSAERPGLTSVLKNLTLTPYEIHKILKTSEVWVSRAQARRPHPSRLAQAMARPGNIHSTKMPLTLLDTRVEHSFNTYENQFIKHYALLLKFHLHRLTAVSAKMMQKNKTSGNVLVEAHQLQQELATALQQATFLREVSLPAHLPTQMTMVLLKHPLYRAVLEGFLEFQKSLTVRLEEPALDAPLENLPKLYQIWGTLHVLAALLHVADELGYRIKEQHLARPDAYGLFLQLLPNGKPIVELFHPEHGTQVQFIPERRYDQYGALYSTTLSQRPDIAIEVHSPVDLSRVYIFDPKYKFENEKIAMNSEESSTPKKVDIDKMHVYRDAIRDKAGNHVVAYAAILYPGTMQQYQTDDIEALQAYPDVLLVEQLGQRIRGVLFKALSYHESIS